ncbi:hypothetical protein C8D70_11871 [Chryseobacterium sp. CBTAP 102]|nr:hypothetical protein C8D70_11871 [Chryseobacterium sp. CBTAP 102]SIQ20213.1 hypothetical protein SAMN05880573_103201 [Chryseobacterium sp. RU33C]
MLKMKISSQNGDISIKAKYTIEAINRVMIF